MRRIVCETTEEMHRAIDEWHDEVAESNVWRLLAAFPLDPLLRARLAEYWAPEAARQRREHHALVDRGASKRVEH